MKPPDTCYVDTSGASIAYQEFGSGAIELVFVMFDAASHLEVLWEEPRVARIYERLGRFARVVLFDRRDTGLSDPAGDALTLEQQTGRPARRARRGGVRAPCVRRRERVVGPTRGVRGGDASRASLGTRADWIVCDREPLLGPGPRRNSVGMDLRTCCRRSERRHSSSTGETTHWSRSSEAEIWPLASTARASLSLTAAITA